jgi:hypothetical protein
MRIRIILGMLLAVAMSLAPLAMASEQAMAATPAHHAEMTGAAHCADWGEQDQSKASLKDSRRPQRVG